MKSHLETYQTFQPRLLELQQAAVQWGLAHKSVFERAARKLGMLAEHGTLVFDDESEMTVLMDGLIYEEQVQQRRVVAAFLAGYTCRDEIDRRLAEAMRTARFGLYRIETTVAERAEIQLKALVAESTDTTLLNIALAKTAKPGFILALRALRLPEFSMASGVLFPFAADKEQRLMREWRKKQGLERYVHMFRLSRKEGIQTAFQ
jgi:hypothetical protein